MPVKEFLETYPLYKKLKVQCPTMSDQYGKPAVHMYCDVCDSEQTFAMVNEYHELEDYRNVQMAGRIVRLAYMCAACGNGERIFLVRVSPELDTIEKVGQFPAWSIEMDDELEDTLKEKASLYRKGLVCESQSYGLGAFAYYRRVTEEVIDQLIESIEALIEPAKQPEYHAALEKAKQTRVAQEKIDLVKELLPPILRPNGINPLGVLHSELSEGLHAKTDEACLETAEHIRDILVFLVNQVEQSRSASAAFTSSMKALLDKRSKKVAETKTIAPATE